MKKILGILGVTFIMAVSFFNMSSVVDTNQNVDLASIIQNASADSEATMGWKDKITSESMVNEPLFLDGVMCNYTGLLTTVECSGSGNVDCTESEELEVYSVSCW